jgi:hypothetical protein
MNTFAFEVDNLLRQKNVYYDDLISGNILMQLQIVPVRPGGFVDYLKSIGKLGGQNKVPRLSNDRNVVEDLAPYRL